MGAKTLTAFGMGCGRPAFRDPIDSARTSPQGLAACREMIDRLAGGEEYVDVPFPLVPDSAQRLVWGVPFLDELDDVCRPAFERVMTGWPGHVFSVMEVKQAKNRRLAAGVMMPYDRIEDLFGMMDAGKTGERLATGLVIPDDDSAEAHDAFGELTQVMLTAALAQRISGPDPSGAPGVKPFSASDLLDATPSMLLDVQAVASQEFAGRLISFTGHYALALLANPPK